MKSGYPRISVIIPARDQQETALAIAALKKADYPRDLLEVLLACGVSPSRQRNEAVKRSTGRILYFLDNDSEIEKSAFRKTAACFDKEGMGVGVVGGPNIWDGEESFWASLASMVLESLFVHGRMAARYRPLGQTRRVSEKELILCNLAVRRSVFQKVGGFNEVLYPNEENELLNRIEKAGYKLIYQPQVVVFRPRRQKLRELLRAFFYYGRGRMEQIRIEGVVPSLPFLAPLMLLIYLVVLYFYHPRLLFLPLALYTGLAFGSALAFAGGRKKPYLAVFLPLLFFLAHLCYALGFIKGWGTDFEGKSWKRLRGKITVVKLKKFGQGWKV